MLDVDPSLREGGGTGTYSMRRDGELVWEGARPWTLWNAVVTDGGFVGGYAYTEGIGRASGDLLMLVLTPAGDIRVEDRIHREGAHHIDGDPIPTGTGIVHVPEAERVIFKVYDENASGELWIGYQLPDCHELFRKRPSSLLAKGDARIYRPITRSVPGAPLFVAEWERYEFQPNRQGAYVALLDADANPVWQLARPNDWKGDGKQDDYELTEKFRAGEGLLDVSEPLHFALWAPTSHQRTDFEVRSTSPTSWQVIELGTHRYDDILVEESDGLEPGIHVELEERSVTQLDTGSDPKSGTPALQTCSVASIDALGRVLMQDRKSGAVFAFDSDGRRLFVGVPSPKDVGRSNLLDRIGATRDGGVIVPRSQSEQLVFGPHGEALGVREQLPKDFSVDTTTGMGAGTRYSDGWVLLDADGKLVKHIERLPDRHWLQDLSQPSWSPGGTLGLIEHGARRPGRPFKHQLLLYASEGEFTKSIPLPDECEAHTVVLSSSRAVVFSWGPKCAIMSLRNGELRWFEVPDAPKHVWTWGFTPSGRELLGLDVDAEVLHRFSLP